MVATRCALIINKLLGRFKGRFQQILGLLPPFSTAEEDLEIP